MLIPAFPPFSTVISKRSSRLLKDLALLQMLTRTNSKTKLADVRETETRKAKGQ